MNLLEEKREKFIAAVRKWEMLVATKVKMSGNEKYNKQRGTHTRFPQTCNKEVSRCSHAKQQQRNVQKSVPHEQSCFFANYDLQIFLSFS